MPFSSATSPASGSATTSQTRSSSTTRPVVGFTRRPSMVCAAPSSPTSSRPPCSTSARRPTHERLDTRGDRAPRSTDRGIQLRHPQRAGPGPGVRAEDIRGTRAARMAQGTHTGRAWPIYQRLRRARLGRSEEHTSELQSQFHLVCRLLLEKKKKTKISHNKIKNNHKKKKQNNK